MHEEKKRELLEEYKNMIDFLKKAEKLDLPNAVDVYRMKIEGFELACRIMGIDLEEQK